MLPSFQGHLPILTFSDVHKSNPDLKGAKGKRDYQRFGEPAKLNGITSINGHIFCRFHCENFTQLNQGCKPPKSRNRATPIIHPNPPPPKKWASQGSPNISDARVSSPTLGAVKRHEFFPIHTRCTPPGNPGKMHGVK